MKVFSKSWLRILSGLFTNLAAAWLGLVIITPNFWPLSSTSNWWLLIYEITFATMSLVVAVRLDERIKHE